MSSVLKRIKEIAKREGISITALEASIGASKGVFSRALANGTDIQSKWLVGMAENYPQYSSEWLLVGKGDMLKVPVAREDDDGYEKGTPQYSSSPVVEALRQVIATQEKMIHTLEKQIVNMENELQALKK